MVGFEAENSLVKPSTTPALKHCSISSLILASVSSTDLILIFILGSRNSCGVSRLSWIATQKIRKLMLTIQAKIGLLHYVLKMVQC